MTRDGTDAAERGRIEGVLIQARKLESIGARASEMSHELNNSLASIVAFSQLLRTDPDLPAELRKQADLLVLEANRTRTMVQTLLDVIRQGPTDGEVIGAPLAEGGTVSLRADDKPMRVLVVDDEPSIRDFLGRVLSRSGYVPVLAVSADDALDVVRTDPPDAILCDHRLAGMSGTEFHLAVAHMAPGLARRFAFLSGDVLNPELRDFASARGVGLLAKPFDIATVGSIVATLLAIEPD